LVPESSSYRLDVLFGSQELLAVRWKMLGMILGKVASRSGFTWRLSLPTWGVDADEVAYSLHQRMACSCQAKGHGLSAKQCPILSMQ
jgi:hypothetical protein